MHRHTAEMSDAERRRLHEVDMISGRSGEVSQCIKKISGIS